MGDEELSTKYRHTLDRELSAANEKWEAKNSVKAQNYIESESGRAGIFTILLGAIGAAVAGPPGAMIGAAMGASGSAAHSYRHRCN